MHNFRHRALRYALVGLAVVALASVAVAQRFPERRAPEARNVAGQFDYYSLVLSWSPSYCASRVRDSYDPQCDRNDGKRYSFVLHGLWPQYMKGWPENCPTVRRPFVPRPLIDQMLDIMPSDKLVIHEYRKHGTCSGLDPNGYYELSRKLFQSIVIPDAYRNPFEPKLVRPSDLAEDFQRANPWLKPDMFAISCGGAGNRLREVRFCFSKDGAPRACGNNEDQRRLCSADKMYMPPVRATRPDAPSKERSTPSRPTVIPNARNI